MARGKKFTLLAFLLVILLIIPFSYIYGGVKIQSRDGRTFDVPVNKDDIISITFEDQPVTGGGLPGISKPGICEGGQPPGTPSSLSPHWEITRRPAIGVSLQTIRDNTGSVDMKSGLALLTLRDKYRETALRERSPLSISPSPAPISVS
jgi:hypothetical protein